MSPLMVCAGTCSGAFRALVIGLLTSAARLLVAFGLFFGASVSLDSLRVGVRKKPPSG